MHLGYATGYWRGLLTPSTLHDAASHPLRCLISNDGFGTNQGDRAILAAMRNDVQAAFPGVEIRGFLNAWIPGPRALLQFWRDMRWTDVFILGGGQLIHDQTCLLFLAAGMLKLLAARLTGTPFVCYGIGVGPLHSPVGRRAVRALLNKAALILVRDDASQQLLLDIGVAPDRITMTADAAFRLPPQTEIEARELLRSLGLADGDHPRVAICPRRWFHYRHGVLPARWRFPRRPLPGASDFAALLDALAALADTVQARGGTVVLLPMKISPHTMDPGQDDDVVCRELQQRMAHASRVCLMPDGLSPQEVATILTHMDAVVTMRMHAAILASTQGVPAVGLALSDKFDDCFARLGQTERLIPVKEATRQALLARLDDALECGQDGRRVLRQRADEQAARAATNAAVFAAWIRNTLNVNVTGSA